MLRILTVFIFVAASSLVSTSTWAQTRNPLQVNTLCALQFEATSLVCPRGQHFLGDIPTEFGSCGGESRAGIACENDPRPGDFPAIDFDAEVIDSYTRCISAPFGTPPLSTNPVFQNIRESDRKPLCPAGFNVKLNASVGTPFVCRGGAVLGTLVECEIKPEVVLDQMIAEAERNKDRDDVVGTVSRALLAIYILVKIDPNSSGCDEELGCRFSREIFANLSGLGGRSQFPPLEFTAAEALHLNELFSLVPVISFSGVLTPIVVDLGEPGLDLTGLDDPVLFDLDADGELELVSWTAEGSPDAFLAFDRNENGKIDDGMELFGDAVELASGMVAMQGYEALAEFDLESRGGNGNGFADVGDPGFWKLRLWTDTNHNGRSEASELHLLVSKGVFSISVDPTPSDEVDEHGNRLAFSSPAYAVGRRGARELQTIDVIFQTVELDEIER